MAKAYRVLTQCFVAGRIRNPGDVVVDDEFTGPVPRHFELIESVDDDNGIDGDERGITPAALDLAESSGIDLSTVIGTGRDGTITKGDVQAAIEAAAE